MYLSGDEIKSYSSDDLASAWLDLRWTRLAFLGSPFNKRLGDSVGELGTPPTVAAKSMREDFGAPQGAEVLAKEASASTMAAAAAKMEGGR